MSLTPLVATHLNAALAALVLGPVALWARRGRSQRPRLHRAFGHAWVTLMIATAVSAVFIRDTRLPNIAGFTPIHLLIPLTLVSLVVAFRALARGDIARHRWAMQRLYVVACLMAGAFTLLPNRFLGNLVLVQWLGLDVATRTRLWITVTQIVSHTPTFVWALFAALIAVGLLQARERRVGVGRATTLPVAMMALSLWGTVSLFAAGPHLVLAIASWLAGAVATFLPTARTRAPDGTRFDASTRSLVLPASWTPLVLIVGVFALRYAVKVASIMHPELALDTGFVAMGSLLSGLFTGTFGGRAARTWHLLPEGGPAGLRFARADAFRRGTAVLK
jgi:uncharacterized membrane protein